MIKIFGVQQCLRYLALTLGLAVFAGVVAAQTGTRYVVAADDLPQFLPNTATVFAVGNDGILSQQARLHTGGYGNEGGYFASSRAKMARALGSDCLFVSNASSGDISALILPDGQVIGNYPASASDVGSMNGIGLVLNKRYLYAGYSDSRTIAAFSLGRGCTLSFIADVPAAGLNGGGPAGLALHGDLLIAAYGDGSIESFNVSSGTPVSNGDLQNSRGFPTDNWPSDVMISKNGHYAIFGDNGVFTTLEVSDISSGKLAPPVLYDVGAAFNATNLRLSPDGKLLYISNNASGQVTAVFFNSSTGVVTPGCTSPILKDFVKKWSYATSMALATDTGTGGQIYVAEFGSPSWIGVVNVQSSGGQCTLTEDPQSPVMNSNSSALISINAYTVK